MIRAGQVDSLFHQKRLGDRAVSLALYMYVYNHFRIVDLPVESSLTWFIGFLSQDLVYYLTHRAIHEAGVFWSFHQMHHSSEYYNLSTALRKACLADYGTILFDVLQSFIVPPPIFLVHRYLNFLYQFWIHTEIITSLGPLEYILNTPSHHRVHHGRNPYCIDKNYGGTLIIWDRLFGTFEWERDSERPIYGAVDNVKTFDQLYLQLAEKLTKEEREQATITYPEEELISAVQERQLQECRKSNLAVVKAPDGADGAKTKTGVVRMA
ncbi:Alkylglycerol monooxygenase -like protein [Toxocara canis]|uniref:Alkylglycerol monooxygenase-like protein n=1 Tax=Toxocara canis TaxID=6265 RepID=A0A0B2VT69_TOXCA|nr:Alkylglycerol monooxygenase -like protein [Toxocara canis]